MARLHFLLPLRAGNGYILNYVELVVSAALEEDDYSLPFPTPPSPPPARSLSLFFFFLFFLIVLLPLVLLIFFSRMFECVYSDLY